MKEKLKFPLKLEDGTIITTLKEAQMFFINREQETNEQLLNRYKKNYSDDLLLSYKISSSGINGYGLELI
jgi:hypothetical protein